VIAAGEALGLAARLGDDAAATVAAETARPSAGLAMASAYGLTSPSRRPGLFNARVDAFRREVEALG